MELENTRINNIKKDIDLVVNENINCVYDDFLINELMVVFEREIIRAFNTGVYLGDTRNYMGEDYLSEMCTKQELNK